MAKPINLPNGRSWKTQTAALAHFKDMLARHSDNQVVESRSDHDDVVALLERHDGSKSVLLRALAAAASAKTAGFGRDILSSGAPEGIRTPDLCLRRATKSVSTRVVSLLPE